MDHLGDRNELGLRVRERPQIGDGPLLDPLGDIGEPRSHGAQVRSVVGDLVHRRHVHAVDVGELAEHLLTTAVGPPRELPVEDDGIDLGDDLLAIAQHHQIEEIGDGLGVVGAMSTGDDQRMFRSALGSPHRYPCEVDHVEEIRIGQFRRQVEADDIE